MAVQSNIIFSIGSKLGPGGLASLQAGIGMVAQLGKMVANAIKETDKYSTAYSRMEISIRKAEEATKGLIDTTAMITNANKFAAAGMKITEEQLRDVALVAADFAKKTGGDATDAMNQLTTAISGGRTFTLKKFNIDLKESADRSQLFADAMEQVSKEADGVNVQLETTSEKFFAIKNNVSTAAGNLGHFFNVASAGEGPLDMINAGMSDVNASFEDMFDLAQDMGQEFFELGSIAEGVFKEIEIAWLGFLKDLPLLQASRWKKEYDALLNDQESRLEKMRQNEQRFRERTGRGSVAIGGGRDGGAGGFQMPAAPGAAGGATEDGFSGLGGFMGGISADDLAEDANQQQLDRIDMRSTEISQMGQMRDIQAELRELSGFGIDVEGLQSDFGLAATEENNDLKQAKLDLVGQELDLLRDMNAEKIAGLEAQIDTEKKLTAVQLAGQEFTAKGFNILGRTAGAYFDSVISGTAFSAEAAKNMIADLSKQEAVYYSIQAIVKTGEGIFAAATGQAALATAAFTAAAKYTAGAAAFGTLAAALGGGKGAAAAAPSAAAPGATGAATVVAPSVGGGGAGNQTNEIVVVLQGDADRLFTVVQSENLDRRAHGLSTLEG